MIKVHLEERLTLVSAGSAHNRSRSLIVSIDTQFLFGLTSPIPATFYTTAGTPPFIPDIDSPTDGNEPYLDVSGRILLG